MRGDPDKQEGKGGGDRAIVLGCNMAKGLAAEAERDPERLKGGA